MSTFYYLLPLPFNALCILYYLALPLFILFFSHFVIWILAWVSSLFVDFIAFNFYLLSFLLVFSLFSSICSFMSLCKSIIIYLFLCCFLCKVL